MANTQIAIDKNGKVTLSTAGKYCDRNIDINVDVEEIIQHANIPDYVKKEALRVAQAVQAVRKDDSIVFLAMSDNHHYGVQENSDQYPDAKGIQTSESNLHAAMAAKILAYALKFDFMAQMGDMTWGSQQTTSALLHEQVDELTSFLRESHKDIPCFHAIGNHDTGIYYHNAMIDAGNTGVFTESGEWLYSNFTALSESENTMVSGQANGGYCYRDFPGKKLRVFLLNTSEALIANQQDKATLGSQRKWFADALVNLNSKSDASAWSFMVLSHYPADYGNTMPLSELLKAYVEGGSITIALESGSNATISFSGKNSAKMIAQFHGHVHSFLTSKLYTYQSGKGVKYDAWRVCIPNGQFNRENTYTTVGSYTDINFAQDVTYNKTADSAKDTSFVINVITPSEQKINSICYGAGVDRVIGYAATVYYSITATLTNVTLTGGADSVEAGQPYNATLTLPNNYEWKTVKVTMGGTDITASAYSNGVISIAQVTGNIVITASATEIVNYTNQIPISTDASGNVYNGVGYKQGVYLSSGSESTRSGIFTTGFIPCGTYQNYTVRMKNVTFDKDASDKNYHRIAIYDANRAYLVDFTAASTSVPTGTVTDDNGVWTQFKFRTTTSGVDTSKMAYFRLCCSYIGEDSVITINEEID